MDRRSLFVKLGKLGEDDKREEDYAHWDTLGDKARFDAAWDLVVQAYKIQGRDPDELRFQRSIARLVKKPS